MYQMRKGIVTVLVLFSFFVAQSQQKTNPKDIQQKMEWFADAKLGIFIHWGIYAVNGVSESWSFHNGNISWEDYMKQLSGFTASKYDPETWADLIQQSGARYSVMTTKHHDGVALWDSKEKHYDVVDQTPAKRDLLAPFYNALRKRNIKTGAYFSLIDWSHPDYPGFLKEKSRYSISEDYERWQRFRMFFQNQLKEVSSNYNPDLWWFDGDWEHNAEEWEAQKIRQLLTKKNPNTVINGRLMGWGDYDTPEQHIPVSRPEFNWWELCMTINDNWGWRPMDKNWKTPYEIITIFVDVISKGGNLLLDIGPKADGTIPDEQVYILKELGAWNKANAAGIFGTRAGMAPGHFYGPSTLSMDSTKLYLFVPGNTTGPLMIKGLANQINGIKVLGSGKALTHKVVGKISWSAVPGIVYIDLPKEAQTSYMSVVELSLEKPIKLYTGKGGFN
jgi:alpha-L-fucosidase